MISSYRTADRCRPRPGIPPFARDSARKFEAGRPSLYRTHSRVFILNFVKQNILVDSAGHACLSDIGFAMLTPSGGSTFNWAEDGADGHRWAAPEIFRSGKLSKQSDVFTYGFVTAEVCSLDCHLALTCQPSQDIRRRILLGRD